MSGVGSAHRIWRSYAKRVVGHPRWPSTEKPSLVSKLGFFRDGERTAGCYAAGAAPLWRDCCKSNSTPWRKAPWAMRICCSWKVSNTAHITLTPPAMTGRNSSRKPCSGSRSMSARENELLLQLKKGRACDFASGVAGLVQGLADGACGAGRAPIPLPKWCCSNPPYVFATVRGRGRGLRQNAQHAKRHPRKSAGHKQRCQWGMKWPFRGGCLGQGKFRLNDRRCLPPTCALARQAASC